MLSERIRNAGVGTFQEMWNEIADEAAKYERVARAADTMIDKLFPIANMRKDVDSPEAQEMFAALADLPEDALGG